jgi:hypothetical protein
MNRNSLVFVRNIFIYLLVCLSIMAIARLCFFEYRLFHYPYQWELREGLQLHHGILLSEGKELYSVSPDPPIVIEPYGPINPLLLSEVIGRWGKALSAPRLLSFLFFITLLILIAAAVYRLTHQWLFVVIAIGINTFILSWVQWMLLCRPDSLGSLLLFASLFVHWLYPYRKIAIYLSLLMIILAFFTKVYFVLGLLLIPLSYWIFHRDRMTAFWYFFSGAILLAASIAIANLMTGGLYHLFTFVLMSKWVTYSLEHLLHSLKGLLVHFLPLFVLIIYSVMKRDFRYRELNVFWLQIIIGIPLFMGLLLNTGAETYYWYSVIPVLTIAGLDVLNRELRKEKSMVAMVCLVLLFCFMANKMVYSEMIRSKMIFPSDKLAEQWKPVADVFNHVEGSILTDDATVVLAIQTGKPLHREGLGYMNLRDGIMDALNYKFRDIDAEIANHMYALIINPENESYVKKQSYRLDRVYNVPLQFGKPYPLKMYVK